MNKNGLIYLASPYSDPNPEVTEQRYQEVLKATHYLMDQGYTVFSPIVHCHVILKMYGLPTSWEYWKKYDSVYLEMCSELLIYTLPGWEHSKGIRGEIDIATALMTPIEFLSPETVNGGI
jgi:hypothetical protein